MQPTLYVPKTQPPKQTLPGNKFLDSSSFNFEETALIRPPFEEPKNKLDGHKYTRVVIDSRDRDRTIYPRPNKYEIQLETDIQDVVSGEVIIKDIPLSQYIINIHNNVFYLDNVAISLPVGNYDAATFVSFLNAAIAPRVSVSYNMYTDKYTWTAQNNQSEFEIAFTVTDTALILGFEPGSVNKSSGGVLVSPNCVNFSLDHYCVLRINQFTINNSSNPILQKSTALISKTDVDVMRTMQPIKKYFNPLIPRLTKISVSFTDYYGNPYDFHNKDHRLEILLESKKILTKFSSFV